MDLKTNRSFASSKATNRWWSIYSLHKFLGTTKNSLGVTRRLNYLRWLISSFLNHPCHDASFAASSPARNTRISIARFAISRRLTSYFFKSSSTSSGRVALFFLWPNSPNSLWNSCRFYKKDPREFFSMPRKSDVVLPWHRHRRTIDWTRILPVIARPTTDRHRAQAPRI